MIKLILTNLHGIKDYCFSITTVFNEDHYYLRTFDDINESLSIYYFIEFGEVIVVDFRLFETLTLIEQRLLLEHEIYHIQQNHLNAPDSIDIEFQADKEAINSFKGYDYSNQMVECLIKCVNYSIMRREHLRSTGKWIKDNSFISDKDLKQMIQMRIDRIKSN
jgi:hypothetical protein